MNILVLSDLHLDCGSRLTQAESRQGDIVVLAGDIHVADRGVIWARERFAGRPVLFVAGNHEFYGQDIQGALTMMRETAQGSDVRILDRDEVIIQGVRFLGATLWTDFNLFGNDTAEKAMRLSSRFMNDYRRIWHGGGLLRPEDTRALHGQARAWLEDKLKEPFPGPTVVITHHAPSLRSSAPLYQKDLVTAAFASNLSALLDSGAAQLWIHGHTHQAVDYIEGKTRIVCNPKGYTGERTGFVANKLVCVEA